MPGANWRVAGLRPTITIVNVDEYHLLREHGLIDKVEMLDGRVYMGSHEMAFTPEQVRLARALGIELRSCVDAVVGDAEALGELRARLEQA
jgi:hypothetical protein